MAITDGLAHRSRERRGAEIAVGTEHIGLSPLLEQGLDLQRVRTAQAHAPAGRRAAARELDDHPAEGGRVVLPAAEAPRLQDPVQAGSLKLLVRARRVVGQPLALLLALQQSRAKFARPRDQVGGRGPGGDTSTAGSWPWDMWFSRYSRAGHKARHQHLRARPPRLSAPGRERHSGRGLELDHRDFTHVEGPRRYVDLVRDDGFPRSIFSSSSRAKLAA